VNVDIGVSMDDATLAHKRGHDSYYWALSSIPKLPVRKGSRLWVANRGRWRGYFVLVESPLTALWINGESCHEKDGGVRKHFRGFTYQVPAKGKK